MNYRRQVAELQNELKSSTERMLSSSKPKAAEDSGDNQSITCLLVLCTSWMLGVTLFPYSPVPIIPSVLVLQAPHYLKA